MRFTRNACGIYGQDRLHFCKIKSEVVQQGKSQPMGRASKPVNTASSNLEKVDANDS